MIEIKENKTIDPAIENAIRSLVNQLETGDYAFVTNRTLNKEQAKIIADKFYEKGYHHEIRMHTNAYGRVFFYCLNVSRTPIRTSDARFSWSEYVR